MRRLLGAVALAVGLTARTAVGQTVVFYLPSDTALTILTNRNGVVDLVVSGTGGVMAYSITLFMDRSRVDVAAADTVPGGYGLPQPTLTANADSVVLTASGTGTTFFTVYIARLTFHLDTLAQQGSLVSLRVNSLTRGDGSDGLPPHRSGILNVCQALNLGGDVTADRIVNSRDALVILTAAVGLPVVGFDVTPGDVDLDNQVTSRDALFTLAYGIGLSLGTSVVGKPLPNACAPLAPSSDSLLFFRSSTLYRVGTGDTLLSPLTLAPSPYPYYRARWSPDGSKILYTAYTSPYYYEIVAANGTGTVIDTLTRNTAYDAGADWAPDGSRIAFVSGRASPASIFLMDANGANPVQLTANLTVHTGEPVSWSPDGTRIAFVAYQTCCSNGLWVANVDGTGLTEVVPGSALQSPGQPDWSAGADSIYYYRGSTSYVRVTPVIAGDTGRVAIRLSSSANYPAGSRAGVGFWSLIHYPYDFFLRRSSDGRYLRLVRGTTSSNDAYFSFRRGGAPYVSSVTVAPKPVTVGVSATQALTATVTNSDASTNTTAVLSWITRNGAVVSVTPTGSRTANATGVGTGSAYVVVTVGGWRSDSVLVTVP